MSFPGNVSSFERNDKSYGTIRAVSDPNLDKSGDAGKSITDLQHQASEVKEILKDVIDKASERGQKIEDLLERSEHLEEISDLFKDNARDIKEHTEERNWKLICCVACMVVILLVFIVIVILAALKII